MGIGHLHPNEMPFCFAGFKTILAAFGGEALWRYEAVTYRAVSRLYLCISPRVGWRISIRHTMQVQTVGVGVPARLHPSKPELPNAVRSSQGSDYSARPAM